MTSGDFYRKLGLASLVSLLCIAVICVFPMGKPYLTFGLVCYAFSAILAIAVYYVGSRLAALERQQYYTSFSLVFGMFKIFLLFAFVFIYANQFKPENSFYLIPFFTLYLIFTILETHILIKLGYGK